MCSNQVFAEVLVEILLSKGIVVGANLVNYDYLPRLLFFLDHRGNLFSVHRLFVSDAFWQRQLFCLQASWQLLNHHKSKETLVFFHLLQVDSCIEFIFWDSKISCLQFVLLCDYAWHHFLVHMGKGWHYLICISGSYVKRLALSCLQKARMCHPLLNPLVALILYVAWLQLLSYPGNIFLCLADGVYG